MLSSITAEANFARKLLRRSRGLSAGLTKLPRHKYQLCEQTQRKAPAALEPQQHCLGK
jgi:hypothetical protein